MEKLDPDESESSQGSNVRVYNALNQLLTYMPLLDMVDTKCKSVCLFINGVSVSVGYLIVA